MNLAKPRTGLSPNPIIFCDFDGTITRVDVTDVILSRLADAAWREIERDWKAGKIGSRECLERQLALVMTTPEELNEIADSAPLDPGFAEFAPFIRRNRVPFVVTSDGLDCVIRRVLARSGIHLAPRNGIHFYSASARLANGRLAVSFPHAPASCTHGCGTCKPHIIEERRGKHWPVIYIGDGLSDRHAVKCADFVYARQPLLEICRQEHIPCSPFHDFSDIARGLLRWLGGEAKAEKGESALEFSSP